MRISQRSILYNILIGDKIIFLQKNDSLSTFCAYKLINKGFKLLYIFQFIYEQLFYEEVKYFIKGKGIINYIIERKLQTEANKENFSDLQGEQNKPLGKYINVRKIEGSEINQFKIEEKAKRFKDIVYTMNEFSSNICKLYDNDKKILNIKDISKKIIANKLYIEANIILDSDLNSLKEKLFCKDINSLITYMDRKSFKKAEDELNNIIFKSNETDLIDFAKKIKIYSPEDIDKEKKKNNIYNMIKIVIILKIKEKIIFFS